MNTLKSLARALGGDVVGAQVKCPGPGHSPKDDSLSVWLSPYAPGGFRVFSHADDDFALCRDYVSERLGLPRGQHRNDITRQQKAARAAPSRQDADELVAKKRRAATLWGEGVDPRGTLVEVYLRSRALELPSEVAQAIRFHPVCPWREGDVTLRVSAMICAMRDIQSNELVGVHRTRLTSDGRKVERRMLGIAAGTAIKIDPDDSVTMGLTIGEGVETCLSARQLGLRPAWALGSAGAIASFPILPGIEAITLLREADATSERAVNACAARWHAAEREILIVDPATGNDLNDALRSAE